MGCRKEAEQVDLSGVSLLRVSWTVLRGSDIAPHQVFALQPEGMHQTSVLYNCGRAQIEPDDPHLSEPKKNIGDRSGMSPV
jgi:hypothetical protein